MGRIGANLSRWDDRQLVESKAFIAQYKEIRHIIQKGDLHRLVSIRKESYSAIEYISQDKTEIVLFAFSIKRPLSVQTPVLCLKGLDPDKIYSVDGTDRTVSGQYLMTQGLTAQLHEAAASILIRIKQVL
jgi:alpha-galactosidase